MATVFDTRNLLISTLSPVNMGTDQDYEPTNYVIDGEALYEFDPVAAARIVPAAERRQLSDMLDGRPDEKMLKGVQGFFHRNRDWLIPNSINTVRVWEGVVKLYNERVGTAANVEGGGAQVINKLEIQRTFFNPIGRRPILPGSGLKGAIRTALLDAVNDGQRPLRNERNQDLQRRLFKYGNDRGGMGDLHRDPLRLVQLGDASWVGPDSIHGSEIRFAVNRKKHPVERGGTLVQSQAETKGLFQLLECVPAFRMRAFQGSLNIQDVSSLRHNPSLPDAALRFDFAHIARACNRFYRPILEAELDLLQNRGYLDAEWKMRLDDLLGDSTMERLDRNRAFLLRVGRHSGAESVTLNGVRSIKIMKGRGETPEYLAESKTVWLAANELNEQRKLMPFGWLLVELVSSQGPLPEWSGLDEFTKSLKAEERPWRAQVERRQTELQQQLEARQARAVAREAEEKTKREEQERREARRQSMTETQQAIQQLDDWLEEDRAAGRREPGGRLANGVMALFNEADDWGAADRQNLADLAGRIYAFIGWGSGRKKKERRARIEALKGGGASSPARH